MDDDVFNRFVEIHNTEGLTREDKPIMDLNAKRVSEMVEEAQGEHQQRLRIKHNKDAADSFDPDEFVKKMTEQRDAVVSTIQHHFTAEQLLDTLNNLNPDLHDDVLVAVYKALGKPVYIGLGSLLEPLPRKTEHMSWAFINGNLVVKQ